jgi:serine protease Do
MIAVVAALGGCGAEPGAGPTTPDAPKGKGASSKADESKLGAGGGSTKVGSVKLVDRRERTGLAPDTLGQVKGVAPPPKTSNEIYRAIAPATVVVRVEGGIGSGIIIDPAGWVLTNHHVIEYAKNEDFRYEATVLLGKLSKDGAMQRSPKEYNAVVYKADKLRDIALLKIASPPPNLPYAKLSGRKPQPGDNVVALGHAGAGMLWALKSGQISALGKLASTLAELASFKDDEEGKKAREAFEKFVESKNLGSIIQSTCNILSGDSGGPLLNTQGEVVGLNVFSRRDFKTGGLLSFHVHLDELKTFMKAKPKHPLRLVPDPWLEGGGDLSFEDADLDGRIDVLMMEGRQPCSFCPRQSTAVFVDADQNSYTKRKKLPEANKVLEKRDFDAEVIYLQLESNVFIWYDRNNDGRFDALLYDEGTTGLIKSGYDIGKDGHLTRNNAWSSSKPFQTSLFENRGLHERIARIARAAFPPRYTDAPETMAEALPDPVGHTGKAELGDLDRDGRHDSVDISSPFSKRLLLDVDRNFVSSLSSSFSMTGVDTARLDPEVAVVSQGTRMWVFYDTDDDRRFDLVLHAPGSRHYVAVDAWSVDSSGSKKNVPEHVGRKLIRPDLLSSASLASAMRSMAQRGMLDIMTAGDNDGLGSFPDPVADHRGTGMDVLELKMAPRQVITLVGMGSDGYLIDLDRSSSMHMLGPKEKLDLPSKVSSGKFDAEFAYFQRNGIAWTFYDIDKEPGFDVVLVSVDLDSGRAGAGFTISGGRATYDSSLIGGSLVRPSLFTNALLKTKLQSIAKEIFSDSMLE